jgi:RNA-directed DNA polymerase
VRQKLSAHELAKLIKQDPAFFDESELIELPSVRHWLLSSSHMHAPPLGLHECDLPRLSDLQMLASWLKIDGDTLAWFTENPWRFKHAPLSQQHYRFRMLAKAKGGYRLLEVPYSRLKQLQRRLLAGLLCSVPVHEACHGFVKNCSVLTHAKRHVGNDILIQFDLKDFFHSITASRVHAIFRTLGYPEPVSEALTSLTTYATPDSILQRMRESASITRDQEQHLKRRHLPQGAPTSPSLANLSAFRLDLRLDGLAQSIDAVYSRYADDIAFSGSYKLACNSDRLLANVLSIAAEEGYQLNHRKTRLSTKAAQQRLTGIVVNAKLNTPRKEFDRLRAILHQCAIYGPSTQNRERHNDFKAHLAGRIAWILQLNPERSRRLNALWECVDWQK